MKTQNTRSDMKTTTNNLNEVIKKHLEMICFSYLISLLFFIFVFVLNLYRHLFISLDVSLSLISLWIKNAIPILNCICSSEHWTWFEFRNYLSVCVCVCIRVEGFTFVSFLFFWFFLQLQFSNACSMRLSIWLVLFSANDLIKCSRTLSFYILKI